MSDLSDEITFAYAECPKCKRLMPVQFTTFEKEIDGNIVEVDVVHCGRCELVLNFDKDLEITWLTRKEAKAKGWTITALNEN